MFTVRLENWLTTLASNDPYLAPEMNPTCLQGQIYGHPKIKDGTWVTTPKIAAAEGLKITVSGSEETYDVLLGQIDSKFREWLKENRPNWNPEQPITIF